MSTHALLGVKFSDGKILGCYVHFDGFALGDRLHEYLKSNTTTNLTLLITDAQSHGGMRSFYQATGHKGSMQYKTDFLDEDINLEIITESNWDKWSNSVSYRYLVDYETNKFIKEKCC